MVLDREVSSDTPSCPICGHTSRYIWLTHGAYRIWHCRRCSFCFAPVGECAGSEAPQELYEKLYQNSEEYRAILSEARRTDRFHRLAFAERFFFRVFPKPIGRGQLVDVGCGAGRFLQIAGRYGWQVQGIEPAPTAAREGNALGLPIFEGEVKQFVHDFPQARFDVVTAFEVVEHTADPVDFLRQLRGLARPGGYVLVSAPNLRDPFLRFAPRPECWPPIHVNFFSRQALRHALVASGLEPMAVVTNLVPLPTLRQVVRSRLCRAVLKPGLFVLGLLGLIEGHQIAALARRPADEPEGCA